MHQTVRVVVDAIEATLEHRLSGLELLHGSPAIDTKNGIPSLS
jgi:hypothetical protein